MKALIPIEVIEQSILLIRGQKVMLDRDLARLYGMETRVLNQAARRNIDRFPEDFMFRLAREDITNCDILGSPGGQDAKIFKECDGLYRARRGHALRGFLKAGICQLNEPRKKRP
jgi:hypothetical protein